MLPTKFWAEMSWRDFAAADMSKVVAVLPVAAIEQHGPHLPVGVDTFINEGYLATAVKQIPDDMPVLILPIQAVGKSNEHIEYPGTLTFSLETVTRAWTEIGDSVARTGCRKLIFMNSHGGNVPVIDAVARELRVRHRMLAVHAAWHRLGYPAELFSAQERAHGIHGGEAETSLMLAFRPKTVRMSEAQNFVSAAIGIEQEFRQLRVTQPIGFGWMASDLHPLGTAGDASKATAEKGEACAENGAEAFLDLVARRVGFRSCAPQAGAACRRGMTARALTPFALEFTRVTVRPHLRLNLGRPKATRISQNCCVAYLGGRRELGLRFARRSRCSQVLGEIAFRASTSTIFHRNLGGSDKKARFSSSDGFVSPRLRCLHRRLERGPQVASAVGGMNSESWLGAW